MSEIKQALFVESLPDPDSESYFYKVGKKLFQQGIQESEWPVVTKITVQEDVPALHCNTQRVCVWVGEELYAELPYHGVKIIGYK